MELKRRIKNLAIEFISLVNKGANQKTLIIKSISDPSKLNHTINCAIKKIDSENHRIYCIVYSPDEVDTQGDSANAEVIKQASYNFMKSGMTTQIDKQHDQKSGEGFVAESWLTKSGDPLFLSEPEGSWAVGIVVEDADTWSQIEKGEITGISLQGMAEVETISKAAPTQSVGGTDYPASDFAYVPDPEKPSTWKFPIFDKAHVANAVARLNQATGISDADMTKIKSKLRAKYKEYFPDVKPADYPTIIQKESLGEIILTAIGNTLKKVLGDVGVQKDFNSQWSAQSLNQMVWALQDAIRESLSDETVTDKKAAVLQNIDQFRSAVDGIQLTKTNNGDIEMTPEEITKAIGDAIGNALKPLNDKLTTIETEQKAIKASVETQKSELEKRIEGVEKSTSQSKVQKTGKELELEKSQGIWLNPNLGASVAEE